MAALGYADLTLSVRSSVPGLVSRAAAAAVATAGGRPSLHPADPLLPGPLGPTPRTAAALAPVEGPTACSALSSNGAADDPRSPPACGASIHPLLTIPSLPVCPEPLDDPPDLMTFPRGTHLPWSLPLQSIAVHLGSHLSQSLGLSRALKTGTHWSLPTSNVTFSARHPLTTSEDSLSLLLSSHPVDSSLHVTHHHEAACMAMYSPVSKPTTLWSLSSVGARAMEVLVITVPGS
ncbi:LOW QUALITY PROTEIN: uncharacterized protein LOC107520258 [Rousettus aegyptiacus]|uniref:LOW QUALITY PROTEIN: uncharacterized protein LOC107520258 n=1 Tax=Rousettus aegyptiacus TaxID=9407 RepID=UPI00168D3C93|nr:LOW QUALITY PROTEIN: uncharacterized protein LOC107520258 [Rousettus aegyptiacus]